MGAGAFGEVWKARDAELGRWVALKILSRTDAADLERFRREATVAARLSHPGIAAVYEIGESDQRTFIAMEFVDGSTLAGLRPGAKEAARLIRDAALALAVAHADGVVHRDLKPSNLMVDVAGRVVVVDFGLARRLDAPGLTASGMMVGTPSYMSPEQARGESSGPAADLWALGATLYELLAGRPPFGGESVLDTVMAVVNDEPPPLAGDRGLAAIVLKCLNKEPTGRYASASALAADLSRWLNGEAIEAQPSGIVDRAGRRLKRQRVVIGVVAAAVLLAGALWLGLSGLLRRGEGRLSVVQEQRLQDLRQTSRTLLDAALDLRRAGDLDGMRRQFERVDRACAEAEAAIPGSVEPHYRRGRMLRAMMEPTRAEAEQDRALRKEPRYGPALYERIVLRGGRLIDLGAELEMEWRRKGPRSGAQVPSRLTLALRDPRGIELRRGIEADLAALDERDLLRGELECARGWRAWAQGDVRAALECMHAAVAREATLEEAIEALATFRIEEHGEAAIEPVVALLTEAMKRDAGYLGYAKQRGEVRLSKGMVLRARGGDPFEWYGPAAADFDIVVKALPGNPEAWEGRAAARANLANAVAGRGGDPAEMMGGAIQDLLEAEKLSPGRARWRWKIGAVLLNQARLELRRGQDAAISCRAAIEAFNAALAIDAGDMDALEARGEAHDVHGEVLRRTAIDPVPEFELGDRDLTASLAKQPSSTEVLVARGDLRRHWGEYESDMGLPASSRLEAAIADLTAAIGVNPLESEAWRHRGMAKQALARNREERGQETQRWSMEAERDLTEALRLEPARAETWSLRGEVRLERANAAHVLELEAAAGYASALADFDRALTLDARLELAWSRRGLARANLGAHVGDRGEDPTAHFAAAVADFDKALEIWAGREDSWRGRGDVRFNWGNWLAPRGGDAGPRLEEAAKDYSEAIRINPRSHLAHLGRGLALSACASLIARGGAQFDRLFVEAIREFDEALRLRPGLADLWWRRGESRHVWGMNLLKRNEDALAQFEGAAQDLVEALKRAPARHDIARSLGGARVNGGLCLERRGEDPREAYLAGARQLEAVVAARPADAEAWTYLGHAWRNHARVASARGEPWRESVESALAAYRSAVKADRRREESLAPVIEQCEKVLK